MAILVVVFLVTRLSFGLIANPKVIEELQSDPHSERADIVTLLTLPGGRILPVNYLREGDQVFVGADGRWWRALQEGDIPVTVTVRGETLSGRARVVFDDLEYKRAVFARLRPDVPKWLPEWLDAQLVVIDLEN
ncbi:MAG: hypothetical protein OXG05_00985 [Gammaproteobacteria bacterium]|nr:hypothetical protein [Gammaproteobacteria bacterium]